jgi:hypothetical protein
MVDISCPPGANVTEAGFRHTLAGTERPQLEAGAMEDFVAYPSRWRVWLLTSCAAGFVALGLWLAGALGSAPQASRYSAVYVSAVGWICTIFFGLCLAMMIRGLFDSSERLRIGAAGVRAPKWSEQTIPWSEILDVTSWSSNGQKMIILHLRDPDRFQPRTSASMFGSANRLLTGGDVALSLVGTDKSFDEAMEAIAQLRPHTHDWPPRGIDTVQRFRLRGD